MIGSSANRRKRPASLSNLSALPHGNSRRQARKRLTTSICSGAISCGTCPQLSNQETLATRLRFRISAARSNDSRSECAPRSTSISKPKGGKKRAFDIPLPREMILCLIRAIGFGRTVYPTQAQDWAFPADSESGHASETKEDRDPLSKWGNDLRQTFRTIATGAGVSEFDAELLMNHAVPGANAGYVTRHKLLEDHLRGQQQAVSGSMFAALRTTVADDQSLLDWLGCSAIRHAILATPKMDNENGVEGTARRGGLAKGPLPD
jgi:hypothetical protein